MNGCEFIGRLALCAVAIVVAGVVFADVDLNGEWKLDYFPQPDDGAVRTLPVPDGVGLKSVMATVPGNCELDLVHAGILPELEVGLNARALRAYEGHQWLYTKTFVAPKLAAGERAMLRFGGVDTLADYFLNGEKIGESANMLIEHAFDVTKRLRPGENVLQVLLRSVACEAQYATVGELGYSTPGGADGEPFRKAGHAGGWDISPRVFVAGLWRDVRLAVEKPVRIDNTSYVITSLSKNRVSLLAHCRVQAPFRLIGKAQIVCRLSRNGQTAMQARHRLDTYQNMFWGGVENPALWWPKGMGEPALYDATIEVTDGAGKVLATHTEKIGLRTIRLEREDRYGPDRPGQFLFRVNGEPCYVRGSNWVPLDGFHSRDRAFLRSTLEMFDDLNCNMVRVWGGGVYEPDEFFDFCDAHGIMVWQDFMTGCSVFPQTDAYAKATEEEVRSVVLKFRNRASLALWSGNNENDLAFRWHVGGGLARDPNQDRLSRVTIPNVLFDLDVTRDYLPSSPYMSPDVWAGKASPSEDHLWGARGYYKTPFYTNATCRFASEMGYHGCPNRAALERMMTKGCVYPWTEVKGKYPWTDYRWNEEWQFKASDPWVDGSGFRRNSLMTNQTKLMFGDVPTDLDEFIWASQFVQAEAMKTFVERFRTEKFTKKNGLIWWNVRDCWPQISDAVVDYYGGRKRAYYAIRAVQRNQLVAVRDDHDVVAVNDTLKPAKGTVKITDRATGKIVFEKAYDVPANAAIKIGEVPFAGQGLLLVDYEQDGERLQNWFLYGDIPFNLAEVKGWFSTSLATNAIPPRMTPVLSRVDPFGKAKWIGTEQCVIDWRAPARPAPEFRRAFVLDAPVRKARLAVCGLGFFEARIDGRPVTDAVLMPGPTQYDMRWRYRTFDIGTLGAGRHVLSITVGDGQYRATTRESWHLDKASWTDGPKAVARLLDAESGAQIVRTDESWVYRDSPTVFSAIRGGECYDARVSYPPTEAEGAAWRRARIVAPPGGVGEEETFSPCRIAATHAMSRREGTDVWSSPVNLAGVVRLKVRGERGAEVRLACGEMLSKDGRHVDMSPFARCNLDGTAQRDTYILSGDGEETWAPRFTYHGFQHAEVTIKGKAEILGLDALEIHTDFAPNGSFESSDARLKRVAALCERAMRSNFVSIPTDCPQREKHGWTSEARIICESFLYRFDAAGAYAAYADLIGDTQRPSGQISGIAPTAGWGYNWGSGPCWDTALFEIPLDVYRFTGDRASLERLFPKMVANVRYAESICDVAGDPQIGLGDWLAPSVRDARPMRMVFRARNAGLAADAARILGRSDEAARLAEIRMRAVADWRRAFGVGNGRVPDFPWTTPYALALEENLIESAERPAWAARLAELVERNGYKVDYGTLGSRSVIRALFENGYADHAYRLMTQPETPGYLAFADKFGMTSLPEAWGGLAAGAESLNHAAFGDYLACLYRHLGGFRHPLEHPGRDFVEIRPSFPKDLNDFTCEHEGYRVTWRREGEIVRVTVVVPQGKTARLVLPGRPAENLSAGEKCVKFGRTVCTEIEREKT